MRLFVGLFPPPEARADLARAVADLRATRRVAPERWHVTLAFLGEVGPDRLAGAAGAVTGLDAAPPRLRIAGGGTFGHGRSTLLWAGVDGDLGPLADAVRAALRRAGLPYDRKPFRPHLTLARPGGPADADRAALSRYAGPAWTATEVALVHSVNGPPLSYEVRAVGKLGG